MSKQSAALSSASQQIRNVTGILWKVGNSVFCVRDTVREAKKKLITSVLQFRPNTIRSYGLIGLERFDSK